MSQYDDIFKKASETYGVDESLLKAVARQESNFDANSVSGAGAVGVMQLMPGTAAGLGVTDRTDPEQNIMGGAKYLSQLLDKYDGDTETALAAYNAGPGNVAKYGKEKYSGYYTSVLGYVDDYSTGESSGGNKVSLKWWGDIVVIVFIALLLIFGLLFIWFAVKGDPVGEIKKQVKKVVK